MLIFVLMQFHCIYIWFVKLKSGPHARVLFIDWSVSYQYNIKII